MASSGLGAQWGGQSWSAPSLPVTGSSGVSCALCWAQLCCHARRDRAGEYQSNPESSQERAGRAGTALPRLHTEPQPGPAALEAPTACTAQSPVSQDGFATSGHSLLLASPVPSTDTALAAREELSSGVLWTCVRTHSQPRRAVREDKENEDEVKAPWVLPGRRAFPCFPSAGR